MEMIETERGACVAEREDYTGFWQVGSGADKGRDAVVTGDSSQQPMRVARCKGAVRRTGIAPGEIGTSYPRYRRDTARRWNSGGGEAQP